MRAIFAVVMWMVLGLSGMAVAQDSGKALPLALRDWTAWVMHGHEREACPRVYNRTTACAWPGELALEVSADGVRFSQSWELAIADFVSLPGDAQWRPEDIEIDGRAAPLLLRGAVPMLHLPAGTHRVSGRIVWNQRPASLQVPHEVALLSLRVDGRSIHAPQRGDDGKLSLGEGEHYEADSLHIEVARLLHDAVPATLSTWMELSVAGRPREINLGQVLPKGYTVLALSGDLSARVQADGALVVQAQPGTWEIWLAARASAALSTLQIPALPEPWPQQEVLQFASVPRFRIAQLEGLRAVDPEQVRLPDWRDGGSTLFPGIWELSQRYGSDAQWPAYLIAPGDVAKVTERQRGMPEVRASQLQLQRTLWLDFDGSSYTVGDHISGDIGSLRRLDMRQPWQLQSVLRDDVQQLVTRAESQDAAGVEVREQETELTAQARAASDSVGVGWTQPFDSAQFVLNLPPGYRLLGARGAERAYGSWWDAWSLLDLFLGSLLVLLAWRLGRLPVAGLLLAYVLLVWHEPNAPQLILLLAMALAVVLPFIGVDRWRSRLVWLQRVLLIGIVVLGLPFAAMQLRLALYPQLERWSVQVGEASGYGGSGRVAQESSAGTYYEPSPMEIDAPAAAPPPESIRERSGSKSPASEAPRRSAATDKLNATQEVLEKVMVTGSRVRLEDQFQYPADAIPQAGSAMPSWSWNRYTLTWAGPLLPEDDLGVMLSPPWLTRFWRLASVLLLAALLWRLARAMPSLPRAITPAAATPPMAATAALLVLALTLSAGLALPTVANAQSSIPDPALLEALRARLLEPDPRCADDCLSIGALEVRAQDSELTLHLPVQALADGVLVLPQADGADLVGATLDARVAPVLVIAGGTRMRVTAGMHVVQLRYRFGAGRVALRFALMPTRLSVQAPGFEVSGLDRGRLLGNTLSLTPPVQAVANVSDQRASVPAPPFVLLERSFTFDREWQLMTRVQRLAPAAAGFSIAVPLLDGEQALGEAPPIVKGVAQVAMPGGATEVVWYSRLTPAATLGLTAADRPDLTERWMVTVSPLMHVSASGVPLTLGLFGDIDVSGYWHFLPLPGEQLQLSVKRPEAIKGNDQVIEAVQLHSTPGSRANDYSLRFTLRATRAGELQLPLPSGAQLQALQVDGKELPLLLTQGAISVPVRVGEQALLLAWREPVDHPLLLRTPALQLGRSTADIGLSLALPADRWLLFTSGPQIGPAVLLWSELAILLMLAPILGRWSGTPLRWPQWLLLGLGFATVSWWAALLVAAWLLALGQRARMSVDPQRAIRFDLGQVALAVLSVVALLSLILAVPAGLLGSPDMGVVGNGSNASLLQWFHDRSADGVLPTASAWTLPLWVYKAAVLLWALWLANALLGWLRWGWQCFNQGGVWRPWKRTRPSVAAESKND